MTEALSKNKLEERINTLADLKPASFKFGISDPHFIRTNTYSIVNILGSNFSNQTESPTTSETLNPKLLIHN